VIGAPRGARVTFATPAVPPADLATIRRPRGSRSDLAAGPRPRVADPRRADLPAFSVGLPARVLRPSPARGSFPA